MLLLRKARKKVKKGGKKVKQKKIFLRQEGCSVCCVCGIHEREREREDRVGEKKTWKRFPTNRPFKRTHHPPRNLLVRPESVLTSQTCSRGSKKEVKIPSFFLFAPFLKRLECKDLIGANVGNWFHCVERNGRGIKRRGEQCYWESLTEF